MVSVLILGAHTAIAKALRECIEERDIEIDFILATTSEHIEGGLALIDESQLRKADLVVLALGGDLGRKLAEAARTLGKAVLDLTESLVDEDGAEWIFPGHDPFAGRRFDPNKPALIPIGLGVTLVSVLVALAELKPVRAAIVTQESAAAFEQPGLDELSEQVRARFNMRDVEAKVLPGIVGFGVVPSLSPPGAPPGDADDVLRAAIEAGLEGSLPDLELRIMRTLVPTFSADSAVVLIDVDGTPDEAAVRALLVKARGVHLLAEDELLSSADAVGRDDALVGRIQIEPGCVGLWIASDRLRRGSATLAALVLERFLAGR